MSSSVKYEGAEKRYTVKRKKKKLKIGAWFGILVLPAIVFLILGFFLINDGISVNDADSVSYNELGNVDYRVYLKDNDYYDESYLDAGMQYIASLINTINVDFNYEVHTTEELDYNYNYEITANLVITDRNNSSKVLYERPETLVNKKTIQVTDNNFVINEDVDIDYDVYNDYVNAFKSDYALNVDSNLIITLRVTTDGEYALTGDSLNLDNEISITIPLSEQTIDITMQTDEKLNNNGVISNVTASGINSPISLVAGIIFDLLGIGLIGLAIYIYLSTDYKDIYEAEVNRILKNYDRLIVTSKRPNIDENKFENKIRVMSIEELIDVYETTKQPIIYYEVIPGEKSYFIVMNDNTLYKLTITRAWLEKQRYLKEQAKNN